MYPLRFKEILRNYGFGDRWIVREFEKIDLPEDHRVGETWEVCDRPGESSQIVNGWMQGKSLRQAIDECGTALMGRAIVERFGMQFPLLIKLLDASNVLGEHMHPSDELVAERGLDDFSGKTEAWYMLRARPEATILCGHKPGIGPDAFRQALVEDRSRECMAAYEAGVGDSFLLHAGTIHYSAGGLLFYEIMQNSDINIGLRQRKDTGDVDAWAESAVAAVHFEDGFDCRTRPVSIELGANRRTWLIVCDYFAVERLDLKEAYGLEMDGERFRFITAIEGKVNVNSAGGSERLDSGWSCLLPADLGSVAIVPKGEAAVLVAYVPDLVRDVVAPLRAQGVVDAAIRDLGGRSELNSLNGLTGG
jgi:mannose-6-phosphate isomerase